MNIFRDNGAIGALLDEYQKAIEELNSIIETIDNGELTKIVDAQTSDPDCKSIQTILTHVVRAGYTYVIEIRKHLDEKLDYKENILLKSTQEYQDALLEMFQYNLKLFNDYPDIQLEEFDYQKRIKARWGQNYDVEQLYEHAIVHILRHRRQIQRFLLLIRT